jgi:hypothetical protein
MGAHRPHDNTRCTTEQRMVIRLSPEFLHSLDQLRRDMFTSSGQKVTRSDLIEALGWEAMKHREDS